MADIFTSDNSVTQEVLESQEADIADSLRVGEEIVEAHEQRLAGKYKTTEELESAYLELQKKLGNSEQESNVQTESNEAPEGTWLEEAYESIRESGELSERLSKQINEMSGMDVFNAMKNQVSDTSRDLSESEMSSVYQSVGGEDQYQNMISWAGDNFTDAEIAAYDAIIESGDLAQINLALQGLNYRYTDAMGQDGNLLQGKPAAAQSEFRSQAELIQAMSDPRYDNDPAYRQDIIDKLDRSNLQF